MYNTVGKGKKAKQRRNKLTSLYAKMTPKLPKIRRVKTLASSTARVRLVIATQDRIALTARMKRRVTN